MLQIASSAIQSRSYNGCSANAVNTIHILSGVAIADAFTPNGDGKNDIFTIMARGVNTYHMTIYNRWGELVFESYDLATGWDGTYKGSAQPSGVYVYFVAITYYNGQSIAKTGNVTLLR
jgi:gliding motility-associated-like protein